jgi:hypothetical protein
MSSLALVGNMRSKGHVALTSAEVQDVVLLQEGSHTDEVRDFEIAGEDMTLQDQHHCMDPNEMPLATPRRR